MDTAQSQSWVRLTSFVGLFAETEADLLMAALQGSSIPAMRLPVQPQTMMVGAPVVILPIEVFVPADAAAEATELLAEQPVPRPPAPLRGVAWWWVVTSLAAMVAGTVLDLLPTTTWTQRLVAAPYMVQAAASLLLLRAGIRAVAWLARERRPLPDWRVIVTAIGMWALVVGVLLALVGIAMVVDHLLAH